MRAILLTLASLVSTTACTIGDACLHGVCSDQSETRALPGPCAMASSSYLKHCDLGYDAAGRPATAICTIYGGDADETTEQHVRWTYDASGALSRYEREVIGDGTFRWVFEPTRVRYEWQSRASTPPLMIRLYDRALFAFDPSVGSAIVFPEAQLGLIAQSDLNVPPYTWSREGSRLTRTGPGTQSHVFDLDDRGRLVSTDNGANSYVYEGDRLVSLVSGAQQWRYVYDQGGNIANSTWSFPPGESHLGQTYSYDCW